MCECESERFEDYVFKILKNVECVLAIAADF